MNGSAIRSDSSSLTRSARRPADRQEAIPDAARARASPSRRAAGASPGRSATRLPARPIATPHARNAIKGHEIETPRGGRGSDGRADPGLAPTGRPGVMGPRSASPAASPGNSSGRGDEGEIAEAPADPTSARSDGAAIRSSGNSPADHRGANGRAPSPGDRRQPRTVRTIDPSPLDRLPAGPRRQAAEGQDDQAAQGGLGPPSPDQGQSMSCHLPSSRLPLGFEPFRLRASAISRSSPSSSSSLTSLAWSRLRTTWLKRPVEEPVQEPRGHAIAAVGRLVDERPPLGPVPDQPLLLHDPQERLHGVERQLAAGTHPLVDLADAPGAQLPEHLEHVQLAPARDDVGQFTPPLARGERHLTY